jgi:hypothetical protein
MSNFKYRCGIFRIKFGPRNLRGWFTVIVQLDYAEVFDKRVKRKEE